MRENLKKITRPNFRVTLSMILVLIINLLAIESQSQIITVKQDGTGDFTTIQNAVDSSLNGDTVLVYPGIYYENVDLTDKGIVLTSIWLLNQQDSIILQTIIDGNQLGSCVKMENTTLWAELIGFTIQNGTGTNRVENTYPDLYGIGGGIYIWYSNVKIKNCRVLNNFGRHGAGIVAFYNSSIELSGNTITNNWAVQGGGGVSTAGSTVIFDSINLNNIYLNYSAYGTDIAVYYSDNLTKIFLDTCTVMNPDPYYIGRFSDHAVHIDRPPISVLHGKIDPVNADLYVSASGDNSNSGLTAGEPLKNISYALLKIVSDSLNPKMVHVADGHYSPSLTGEHVPVQFKNYVNLVGQSRENTIIDCEFKYEGARFAFGQDFSMAKNLTFTNGNGYPISLNGGISTGYSTKLILDSIALINTTGNHNVGIYSDSGDSIIIKNSVFDNCSGYCSVEIFNSYLSQPTYAELISDRFSWNHPDTSWESRQLTLFFYGSISTPGKIMAKVINCLFNDNSDSTPYAPVPVPIALIAENGLFAEIANTTFANNSTTNSLGATLSVAGGSHINLYNCIFYGNIPKQITLAEDPNEPNTLGINYSLIQDGPDGIYNNGGANFIEWGEGNLDADPFFLGSIDYPYAIDYGSPCIDAGTTDLPPWIELPEYDLAGNPRVWGESVDMGAYEYGPWVSIKENPNSKFKIQNLKLFEVSPNPFSYGTYVSYELKESGRLDISVYSLSGMKVGILENHDASKGDSGKFYWDGTNQQGNLLPDGVYLIRMTMDSKEVESVKVVIK
jgi:hypothetical protein